MPDRIVGPPGTRIYSDGRNTIVEFRDRELVRVTYLDVRLNTGGRRDFTTQARINQSSRLLNLDYHVINRRGIWMVETSQDAYRFEDGMHILRSVGKDHEYVRYEANSAG
jgi:hypothetical protein